DKRVAKALTLEGVLEDGYHPRMEAVHRANAEALRAIIAEHGWPGRALVGDEGVKAAWLVVQHAIGEPAFMRASLQMLREASARADAPRWMSAYLEDRIAYHEGRPQRFGTHFDWDVAGDLSPLPIEDPEDVDARRRAVGLEPLAERTRRMRQQALLEGEKPPADFAQRRAEMENWARSVGWR
ncbi:MAG: hypothetical protein H7Y22_00750, partial [Gemmatimonadaceae bacterium]|nr:hypothetical protein [Gloeobacterales cyanobacterium ES-bin-141]